MSKSRSRMWTVGVVVVLMGLGIYWLASGQLYRWLLAMHGRH